MAEDIEHAFAFGVRSFYKCGAGRCAVSLTLSGSHRNTYRIKDEGRCVQDSRVTAHREPVIPSHGQQSQGVLAVAYRRNKHSLPCLSNVMVKIEFKLFVPDSCVGPEA